MLNISNKRRVFSFVLTGFLLLCFSYIGASNASAATFFVPGDFPTIKDAIADPGVMDGDRIALFAGTYDESNILVNKELIIFGAGIGTTNIDPDGGHGFIITADNVEIRDLSVQNARLGIRIFQIGATFDQIEVERVGFTNNNVGIILGNSTTATNLLIKECQFLNNGRGLRVNKNAQLDGGLVRDSTFDGNNRGIHVFSKGSATMMSNVNIIGNTFQNHTNGNASAINLEEAQNTRIHSNIFMNNVNDIVLSKIYQPGVPMSNVRIYRNTMIGTTRAVFSIYNADNGGQTVFDDIRFTSNDITTPDATVIWANAYKISPPGSGGTGWDTVNIKNNCATGTTTNGRGIRFQVPAGIMPADALGGDTLRARKNWWGTASTPAVIDLMDIPAVTDFQPFLSSCGL